MSLMSCKYNNLGSVKVLKLKNVGHNTHTLNYLVCMSLLLLVNNGPDEMHFTTHCIYIMIAFKFSEVKIHMHTIFPKYIFTYIQFKVCAASELTILSN